MLYPSHVDAFSFAVLESLLLGTPVVGYNIPALQMYYGGLSGVALEEEGDIEAMTTATLDMLENKCDIEAPRMRDWKDIVKEEMDIIEELF
jgi:glycosyltransferase involved in cell wall biosynthesis